MNQWNVFPASCSVLKLLLLPPSSPPPLHFFPCLVGFTSVPYFTPTETIQSLQHPLAQLSWQPLPSVLSGVALRCVHFSDLISPVCPCRFFAQMNFLKTIRAETSSSCSSTSSATVVTAVAALFVYRSLVLVCHNSPVFTAHGPWQGRVIAIAFINV